MSSPPEFESAYLVHGDDHGRIAERRGRLTGLAADVSGAGGVEASPLEGAAENWAQPGKAEIPAASTSGPITDIQFCFLYI